MKLLRQIVLSVAVLAAALYVWIFYLPSSHPFLEKYGIAERLGIELPQAEQPGQDGRRFGGGAVRVVAAEVEEHVLADRVHAIGDARALRSVTLRAREVGIVTEINAAPGALLATGDVVVRLENEAETIAVERATILVEDALEELERLRRLQDNVTEVRIRDAELALDNARLELREAEFDLAQREIRAPISGRVGLVDIEVGDRVQAQDALVTVTDRSELTVDFRLPERVVPLLEVGRPVMLRALALRDTELTGKISAIDTVVDRTSRTLRVQANVANPDDLLRPGMAFEVAMEFPGAPLLSVPPLAVQWSSEGAFVWAVKDGKTTRVPIRIWQRNAEFVLVEAAETGLAPGDLVVVEGVQSLRPGADVEIDNLEGDRAEAAVSPARL